MRVSWNDRLLLLLVPHVIAGTLGIPVSAAERLDFQRDVRPVVAQYCFRCHGPDAEHRAGDLRLDDRMSATAPRAAGPAIVPGQPDDSVLIRRIMATDDAQRMPPPDSRLVLGPQERATLRRWIAEGAEYQPQWSLVPPRAVVSPAVRRTAWPRGPLDGFVLARLEQLGETPSPEASRETLLRRAALDLIGLPPTLDQLDDWLADPSVDAYERAVDRLLASPSFGERQAVEWLDAARYADTNGYFGDHPRTAWLWRDWVIAAGNHNLPFDEFTIRQLAGDLLPQPSVADRIATGFHRNQMANNETGIIDEEYRVEYVADRVETTATTWLGLTLGCARCHDHKFDPFSQREYYQLFAIFNQSPETGLITSPNPPPTLSVPSDEQQQRIAQLEAARGEAARAYQPLSAALAGQIAAWEANAAAELPSSPAERLTLHASLDGPTAAPPATALGTSLKFSPGIIGQAVRFDATQHLEFPPPLDLDAPWTIAVWAQPTGSLGCLYAQCEPDGERRGIEVLWQKGRILVHLVHRWGASVLSVATRDPVPASVWHQVVVRYDGSRRAAGLTVWLDGHRAALQVSRETLDGSLANDQPFRVARRDAGLGFYGQLDELRVLQTAVPDEAFDGWYWSERLRGILATATAQRTAADQEVLLDYFIERRADDTTRAARRRLLAAQQAEAAARREVPTALVLEDQPQPRRTAILRRGQYDQPGDTVAADVPAVLPPWPANAPRNRLGLARWLVAPEHPLTSRVLVNRLWQQCFGEGLVRTANDFGAQGELPTHPELLDWLAVDVVRGGWDVKATLRQIVTSATYRQTSAARPESLARDPDNRWLSRGPRFRLSAEMIRDQALAASGLLVSRLGGPSVKPFQPPGLWEAVSYNGDETYVPDQGAGQWRRSLYTFVKRQAPPPASLVWDAPTREKCVVRRARTNTPLQALVLLNDPTYLAAARHLARQILSEAGDDRQRLVTAFRRATSRRPDDREITVLVSLLDRQRQRWAERPAAAASLVDGEGEQSSASVPPSAVELAAWTVTLQVLWNLDETITRR